MSEAARSLGRPIVLPDTAQVSPSDVGSVWTVGSPPSHGRCCASVVAVTFPAQGLIVTLRRTRMSDPLRYIRGAAHSERINSARLVWLGGVPAWTIPEPANGSNWGMIQFVVGDAFVQVDGHTDSASLQAVAQSIVDRIAAND